MGKDGVERGRPHEFCLPASFASLNLLPDARERVLILFAELGIPWHAGVAGGPGNHLLSSQVQCVNALGLMVTDPARVVRAFASVLGTAAVDQIEPGRSLTFEYIGEHDVLYEAIDGVRVRGAHCTSVDAAFLHITVDGIRELILLEWKYTESYRPRDLSPAKDKVRFERYGQLLADPDGPINMALVSFDDLLLERLYQLARQQLLAHELEKAGAHGAQRVRVAHVHPTGNIAYQTSLHSPAVRALGATVMEVWQRLLRRPDRFVSIDSALFADPTITSAEYAARYASGS